MFGARRTGGAGTAKHPERTTGAATATGRPMATTAFARIGPGLLTTCLVVTGGFSRWYQWVGEPSALCDKGPVTVRSRAYRRGCTKANLPQPHSAGGSLRYVPPEPGNHARRLPLRWFPTGGLRLGASAPLGSHRRGSGAPTRRRRQRRRVAGDLHTGGKPGRRPRSPFPAGPPRFWSWRVPQRQAEVSSSIEVRRSPVAVGATNPTDDLGHIRRG